MKNHSRYFILLTTVIILLISCRSNKEQEFKKQLAVLADTVLFDNSKDTMVFGSKGTGLFFEKESFVTPDGKAPEGKITLVIKECYSISDMIREDLSTGSGNKILETRGMINVRAFANNQELNLKEGKTFIIHFPKDSADRKTQMNLFYGQQNTTGIDWNIDTTTLLRPTAFLSGWGTSGWPKGDSTLEAGFYFKGQNETDIFTYFYENFDNKKLTSSENQLDRLYAADFIVTRSGDITKIKIEELRYDSAGNQLPVTSTPDPYFYEYIDNLPALEPYYRIEYDKMVVFDAECSFYIQTGLYPPNYRNREYYNEQFKKKYSVFQDSTIKTMNDAELNYFIFSSSKLGWINCDRLWEVPEEKIDYVVQVDPKKKPNIKLIFKNVNSIMAGSLEGDKYVFHNIPENQDVKIVAISFTGKKPMLAISETKTGKTIFNSLNYEEFAIADLEKHLSSP